MNSEQAALEKGIALYNQGRFAEAISAFEGLARSGQGGEQAWIFLAHAYVSAGDQGKAVRLLEERSRVSPEPGPSRELLKRFQEDKSVDAPTALLLSAERHLQGGELEKAEAQLREALRLKPGEGRAHHMLGVVLEAEGKLAEARREYEESRRLDATSANGSLSLGKLLLREGDLEGALARLREAVAREPGSVEARLALGQALDGCGRGQEARREYEEVVRLDGGHGAAWGGSPRGRASCPSSGSAWAGRGEAHLRLGDLEKAERHLREASRREPKSARTRVLLGAALERMERREEARREYEEALRLDPVSADACLALGELLLKDGEAQAAEERLRESVRRDPRRVQARLSLGRTLDGRGDAAGARREFEAALELDASAPQTRLCLGEFLLGRGEHEGAREQLEKAAEGSREPGAFHLLGQAMAATGRPAEARRAYEEALRLDGRHVKALLSLGESLSAEGDFEGAEARLRQALDVEPGSLLAHLVLGRVLDARADIDGAGREYEEALRLDDQHPEAHLRLGELLLRGGRFDEAAAHLTRATQGPRAADAFFLLGKAREGANRLAEARRAYEEALRLDAGHGKARVGLGEVLSAEGDHEGAEAQLRRALAGDPGDIRAHLVLGRVLAARSDTEGAGREYGEALRLDPSSQEARLRLGELRLRAKRFDEAAEHLSLATRGPRAADAVFLLGKAREGAGRLVEARQAYEEALRLDAGHVDAQLSLGDLDLSQGHFKEAQARFAEASKRGGDEAAGGLKLAHALSQQGDFEEAARRLEEPLSRHQDDPRLLFALGSAWLEAERREPMVAAFGRYLQCGERSGEREGPRRRFIALMALGEYKAAFQQGEAILDGKARPDHECVFEPWIDHAVRPHSDAFFLERMAEMERLTLELPRSPWAWFYSGLLLCRTRRFREGLAALDRVADFDGDRYGWMRYAAGIWRLFLCHVEGAVEDLRAAAPTSWLWWTRGRLAEAFVCLGRDAEAFEELDRAERAVSSGDLQQVRAWRGEVLLWLGRYEEAIGVLDTSLAMGCEMAACWRGGAAMLLGRFDEALEYLDRAVARTPRDAEALVFRGELHRRMGRRSEAAADLGKARDFGYGLWADVNLALLHAASQEWVPMWKLLEGLPSDVLGAALARLGNPDWRRADEKTACRVFETILEMGRGVRRVDAYLKRLWMRPPGARREEAS
ncbi:MAG: tetratricopeptide repeat protein [Elusimicrobia bacterium]|nr:tetratricopeptide repeat protein [Elusimicrobiota bacterium]